MRNCIIIFISFITISFSFAQVRTFGGPIPGCDVLVGRKPPGGNHIAQGKTGTDGSFEFKNLKPGKGYYVTVDFGTNEQGVRRKSQVIEISDIEIAKTGATTYKNKVLGDPHEPLKGETRHRKSMTNDSTVMTVTAGNGTIKVNIAKEHQGK